MLRSAPRLLASFGLAAAVAACSLAVSLDGFSGGATADDASVAAVDGAPDAVARDAITPEGDAATTSQDGGADVLSKGWKTLSVLQRVGTTAQATVSFGVPTTPGTLLLAMRPDSSPPSGGGWTPVVSSNGVDTVFYWPNNPGGLRTFTIPAGGNKDVFLIEMAGAPSSVGARYEVDTGAKAGEVSELAVTGAGPTAPGALTLLYIDTNISTSATAPLAWTSLGTDNNNNFAWWQTATSSTPKVAVGISATSQASLMLVAFEEK